MRFVIVRGWAAAAVAILAAAVADIGTEFAVNCGWLRGVADNQHESVVPALLAGAALAVSLLVFLLVSRISGRDPLLVRGTNLRAQFTDIACAFCGSLLCIVVMEGYETRFGGISPFDARSVVLSHAPALLVSFLVVGAVLHFALRSAIHTAARASIAVSGFLEEFLRRKFNAAQPPAAALISAFDLYVTHVPLGIADGWRGLRAPPRSIRPRYLVV